VCSPMTLMTVDPRAYLCCRSLVVNIIAGELVPPARRTAVFGMLQGCIMLGQGIGYLSML